MNYYDFDSLTFLTRQRHEQRLHEATAERLARELRATPETRRWLRLRISPASGLRRRAHSWRLQI